MIKELLDTGEDIIWEGKPDKVTYVIGHPIIYVVAFIWLVFDMAFVFGAIGMAGSGFPSQLAWFLIPFFAFHLMPVWFAIGGVIYRLINWKHKNYVITEKRIYMESGIIGRDVKTIAFSDIHEPEVRVGFIEKIRGCGSINLTPSSVTRNSGNQAAYFRTMLQHISDPYVVYKLIKQMSLDISSDIEYPNSLRPEENPGYNTEYRPK
jgi:uncharacterized membrane protein YdbT with pleckstrin-like domain